MRALGFNVVDVEMDAYRPQSAPLARIVIPDDEEADGIGIRINGDDDDNNGTADSSDTNVTGENDLIEVTLTANPTVLGSGSDYILKRSNSKIKVWESQTKGTAIIDTQNDDRKQ